MDNLSVNIEKIVKILGKDYEICCRVDQFDDTLVIRASKDDKYSECRINRSDIIESGDIVIISSIKMLISEIEKIGMESVQA